MQVSDISLHLIIGAVLALGAWTQRKRISYSYGPIAIILVIIFWPIIAGWALYKILVFVNIKGEGSDDPPP